MLVDESQTGGNQKLELWRETLESKGFRLSRTKTEYMRCDFTTREEKDISLEGQVVPRKDTVGDLIPGYPKEEESMNHRTVKTPESAVTSLARPNGSLVPPRPSAHVPMGPALPHPTARGRLRLA